MNIPTKNELSNGTIEWRLPNGLYHREDGPAIIDHHGEEYWFTNGVHHRVNGPAVNKKDGTEYWLQYGQLHRIDGPAIVNANSANEYWLDGVRHDPITFLIKSYEYTS